MEHNPDYTDVSTFLMNIARQLQKEGELLQSMADRWFERRTYEDEVLTQSGVDITYLGRKLLIVTDQLCQTCKIKRLSETLIFPENSTKKED